MASPTLDDKKYFFYKYDVAALTPNFIYGRLSDRVPGRGGITTSGASTTVTSSTADTNSPFVAAFDFVNIGDILWIQTTDTAWATRVVTAKASNTSITVDTAINLSTARTSWSVQQFKSGTTINDGWVNTRDLEAKSVQVEVDTFAGGTTNITFSIEGRLDAAGSSSSYQVINKIFTAVGTQVFSIPEPYNQMRVGAYCTVDGGVQSISAFLKGFVAPAWGGR